MQSLSYGDSPATTSGVYPIFKTVPKRRNYNHRNPKMRLTLFIVFLLEKILEADH